MPRRRLLLIALLLPFVGAALNTPVRETCTYRTFTWNTATGRAEDHRVVRTTFEELRADQRDQATGCSLCEEDQVEVRVEGVPPFRACQVVAAKVRSALLRARAKGERITGAVGYRVGLTRGDTDANGRRTGLSNHAFGIAFDVNEQQNGLYADCVTFGPACRLVRGGAYRAGAPGALTAESPLVAEFAAIGLKWGGVIAGRQKDFMHFSPTGY